MGSKSLEDLFANNRKWSERIRQQDPDFFPTLARQQFPSFRLCIEDAILNGFERRTVPRGDPVS